MNSFWLSFTFIAQVALLWWQGPWLPAVGVALGLAALGSMFAFTRLRWGSHVDMLLIMAGPGGLGMLLPSLATGMECHHSVSWAHYGWMSLGMWLFTLLPMWQSARCVQEARQHGLGGTRMLLDAVFMQVGMALLHLALPLLPIARLPMGHPAVPWLMQALMLLSMLGGMMVATALFAHWQTSGARLFPSPKTTQPSLHS